MGMHEKIAPKRNIFGMATGPCVILESSFHEKNLPCRYIRPICLYIQPFTNH